MAQEKSLLQLKWSELYQQCFDRLGRCVSPALLLALFQWAALASAASFQQSSQLFLRCEKARGSAWTSYRTLVGSWTPKATMRMISQPEDIQWYILYVQCQGWTWHVTFVAQNMRTCDVWCVSNKVQLTFTTSKGQSFHQWLVHGVDDIFPVSTLLSCSLLGTCGEQVMCWRYSCQNGYAILAQAVPPVIQYFRKDVLIFLSCSWRLLVQ